MKFRIVRRVGKRDYPLQRLYARKETAQRICARMNAGLGLADTYGKRPPYRTQACRRP